MYQLRDLNHDRRELKGSYDAPLLHKDAKVIENAARSPSLLLLSHSRLRGVCECDKPPRVVFIPCGVSSRVSAEAVTDAVAKLKRSQVRFSDPSSELSRIPAWSLKMSGLPEKHLYVCQTPGDYPIISLARHRQARARRKPTNFDDTGTTSRKFSSSLLPRRSPSPLGCERIRQVAEHGAHCDAKR